jgi:putative membrane protein
MSLRTGFPFGHYIFTDLMGPKLFELPVLLALAYVGMGYLSWVLGLVILQCQSDRLSGKKVILLPLIASFIMTSWDLSMDPVWAGIDHAWVWRDGGLYFGVPISNFCGWLLTTYTFYQLFALYLKNRPPLIVQPETKFWRLPILFYAASAIGNLLVVAPPSLGAVFVDATGKRWPILEILWASRLVSIFLMMSLCLIAWVRVGRPFKRFTNEIAASGPQPH